VRSADGDVAALAALATRDLDPARGKLIQIAGDHVSADLAGGLARAGFKIERRAAYAARAAITLPEAFNGPLDIVLFHSARAAGTFVRLGAPRSAQLTAACLSQAVADAAAAVPWRNLIVSPAPREADFLQAALA
jgi:uroporphyrinogen-III synthase